MKAKQKVKAFEVDEWGGEPKKPPRPTAVAKRHDRQMRKQAEKRALARRVKERKRAKFLARESALWG